MTLVLFLCLLSFIINLPFGFYRAGVGRFSWQWFAAVHLPVPLVIVMRLVSGVGWSFVPLLIATAIAGQFLGGVLRSQLAGGAGAQRAAGQISVKEDEP